MLLFWTVFTAFVTAVVVNGLVLVWRVRRRNLGAWPLPGWALTAQHLSEDGRILVAKVARASVRDVLQEWEELPPGLQQSIEDLVNQRMAAALCSLCRPN